MALLVLDALPPRTTRGTIVRLLIQVGGLDKREVGAIEIQGRTARVETPPTKIDRVVQALDGAALGHGHIRAHIARGRPQGEGGGDDHFVRMIELLEIEGRAEAEQARAALARLSPEEAERSGASLVDLVLLEEFAALGGRTVVTLAKPDPQQPLPYTRLGVGSPVLLSEQGARKGGVRGVVSDRGANRIEAALNHELEPGDDRPRFRLDLANDEVGRRRARAALERARSAGGRLAELRSVLLGESEPRFGKEQDLTFFDAALNESQREAVRFALSAEDLAVIHGPPGTGKTTTVAELIRQAIARGQKVLACAPSNLAVDNVFERLIAAKENAVRIGHPARVLPELREHTLDLVVEAHPDVRVARKLVREAMTLRDRASRYTRAKPPPGAKREMRAEARELLEDARRIEAQVVRSVLDGAAVVCCTATGLDSELLGQRGFDLAVIDEACQTTEPACWIPLLRSERVVLAGDHCQLPPTVVSAEAARRGFRVSLQERLVARFDGRIARRLEVQYRMHEKIMDFSSAEFYDGALQAHESVRRHLLRDLPHVLENEWTRAPVAFIDTAGAGYDEQRETEGASRLNRQEAELVVRKVEALLEAGVKAEEIAVIAPYSAQVRLLRESLPIAELEVDSVDGFQGREKEAVVLSLVRSNVQGEIGFLADVRRMNVALTRARRKLLVIGDSATVGGHPFYARLLEYFEQIEAYHSVWEEM